MRPVFDRIRAQQTASTSIYVINQNGDYLVHPDRSREFGFEFSRPYGIQDEFPALAPVLSRGLATQKLLVDGPTSNSASASRRCSGAAGHGSRWRRWRLTRPS